MGTKLVITADGSSSIFVEELDEHYHSVHGALQESLHVFIQSGLHYIRQRTNQFRVLEIGFGTGLNALLTALEAEAENMYIRYTAIEKFPLDNVVYAQLNYGRLIANPHAEIVYERITACGWQSEQQLSAHFSLLKLQADLKEIEPDTDYDLIYFDAFAPSAQPELWTPDVFEKMYRALQPGGVLVTYCAKGEVKRNMKAAGFSLQALPGPKGKREMTRAIKV